MKTEEAQKVILLADSPEGLIYALVTGKRAMQVAYVVRDGSVYTGDLLELFTRLQTFTPVTEGEFRKEFWSQRFMDKDWYDRFCINYDFSKEKKGLTPFLLDPPNFDHLSSSERKSTKSIEFKAGRRPLRQEPYDPDARDGDNDGIVQEGTPWERPVGTRFLNSDGQQFTRGLTVINRPKGKLIDADGKEVSYTPTYERGRTSRLGQTIGQRRQIIGETTKPLPTRTTVKPAEDFSAKASGPAKEISDEEFERKTLEYQTKAAGDPKKKTGIWKRWSELKVKVKDGRTVTVDRRKLGGDDPDAKDVTGSSAIAKVVGAHLVATRMRELGYDPSLLLKGKDLWINNRDGRLNSLAKGGGGLPSPEYSLIDPTHPNYQELIDEEAVSLILGLWALSGNMVGNPIQRALQDAATEVFELDREKLSKPDDEVSDEIKNVFKGFMEASYSRTQEALQEMGIDKVRVYRGFSIDLTDVGIENLRNPTTVEDFAGQVFVFSKGSSDPIPINLRPLSSFSTSEDTASSFSEFDENSDEDNYESVSVIVSGVIPRERVVSFPGAGLGCLGEQEFVVRGTRENESDFFDTDFPYFSSSLGGKDGELYGLQRSGTAYDQVFNPEMFEPDEEFDPEAYYNQLAPKVQAIIDGLNNTERLEVLRELWEDDL
jgi:hypothetical protein